MKKHVHKYVLAAITVACLAFAAQSCAVDSEHVTPAEAAELQVLDQQKEQAALEKDPAKMKAADAALAEFEAKVLRDRAGPIVAGIAAFAPPLAPFSPLLLGLLPLLGSRGRKLAGKTLSALNPFTKAGPDSNTKGIALGTAATSLWAYLGGAHATPEGKAAFEGTPPTTP